MILEPGRVLGNRFEIIKQIGSGGMAIVYKAEDYKLHRMVALKVLKHEYTEDEAVLGKFRKEALSAGSLTHPNIVAVYDLGHEEEIDYIVMEYVDGITLKEYIKRRELLSSEEVVKITIKIVEALKLAHAKGIIHRDIKPQNIMVTPSGDVKVMDFGIAKAVTSSTVTKQGEALGSVHYFSPEQARGGAVDARSDLYSVGITMYEMATKKLPFTGETQVAVAMKHLHDPLPNPSQLAPQLWPGLCDIILKLTQKRPEMRYQMADDLIQDLRNIYKNHSYRLKGYEKMAGAAVERKKPEPRRMSEKQLLEQQEKERQRIMKERTERLKKQKKRKQMILSFSVVGMILLVLLVLLLKMALSGSTGAPPGAESSQESKVGAESSMPGGENSAQTADSGANASQGAIDEDRILMPQVAGLTYEEARKVLNERGIPYTTDEQYHDQVEVGYIIEQQPQVGTAVTETTPVVLTVSLGQEQVFTVVPNIVNASREEAEKLLQEKGLYIGSESSDYSSSVPEGHVINQGTPKDTEVPKGSTIDITISLGAKQQSTPESEGGTYVIHQPFAMEDGKGRLVVQAYNAGEQMSVIYDKEVTYSFIELLGGSLKINYPAGTVRVEVFIDENLIVSDNVG